MSYPLITETHLTDESRALLADIRSHGYTVTLDKLADAHTVRMRVHHGRTLVSRSTCTAGPDNAVSAGHAKWLRDVEVLS
jgi:hypothetical protein